MIKAFFITLILGIACLVAGLIVGLTGGYLGMSLFFAGGLLIWVSHEIIDAELHNTIRDTLKALDDLTDKIKQEKHGD